MNVHPDLDDCMARAVDELLTLAAAAAVCGRPELALAANAAMDRLLVWLPPPRPWPEPESTFLPYGVPSHAQH